MASFAIKIVHTDIHILISIIFLSSMFYFYVLFAKYDYNIFLVQQDLFLVLTIM